MKYTNKNEFEKVNMFGTGISNDNYAQYFIGDSFLNFLVQPGESPIFMANVTFEPGCRNNWHIHHAKSGGGQMLICTAGEGWFQKEGSEAISLQEGSVIYIQTGAKHWHGAKADSWFSHISVEVPGTETSNEWLEPVSDEYYNTLKENK
jgi:quercetin dioxygenase-like cupin family protein